MNRWFRLGLVMALLSIAATPAQAQEAPIEVGWWTASQVGGTPLGAASLVPEGGLQVALGPNGPVSIGAVRFTVEAGATVEIRLALEPGSTPEIAATAACPIIEPWQPVAAGSFDDAPAWDCELASTAGAFDPLSSTVRWTFGPDFPGNGTVDVMLLPVDVGGPFNLTFAAPSDDALTVTPAPAPAATDPPATAGVVPPTTAPTPTAPPRTTPPATAAAPDDFIDPTPPQTAPAGLPAPLPTAPPTTAPPPELAAASGGGGDSGAGRVLGAVVLLGAIALAGLTWRGAIPAFTGAPPGAVRGVGRFTAERTSPPPRV